MYFDDLNIIDGGVEDFWIKIFGHLTFLKSDYIIKYVKRTR